MKTGAIDPLDDLAEFCRQEGLWLHVDGAYGGFGVLDPRLAHWYAGMERADSVALDPHKWLAVAIGCSCAMVRQGALLQETYKLIPSYLNLPPGKGSPARSGTPTAAQSRPGIPGGRSRPSGTSSRPGSRAGRTMSGGISTWRATWRKSSKPALTWNCWQPGR